MEITTQSLTSVKKGFQKIFDAAYQGLAEQWFRQFAFDAKSNGAEEEYHWLAAVPGLKELLGEIVISNLARHGFTIKNREWADTIGIKRKDIERDKLGVYTPFLQTMGQAAAYHPGELIAQLLATGFSGKCYTGKAFFAENHEPLKGKQKFSNLSANQLSQEHFRAARANLIGRLNAEGRAMRLGRDLVLVTSPTWQATSLEITVAERLANGATNVDRGTARSLVVPELLTFDGGEDMWFLLEAGLPMKPFITQTEKAPETNMVTDLNDSHVVKYQEFLYQAYCRDNAGYGLPEYAYGSTGEDPA